MINIHSNNHNLKINKKLINKLYNKVNLNKINNYQVLFNQIFKDLL